MEEFNFNFEPRHLQAVIGSNPNLSHWFDALSKLLPSYQIHTQERVAAWLAQCAHESGQFKFLRENLNYRAESLLRTFPKYFPDLVTAKAYEKRPEKIANRVYANRMGNGDEASGDGFRYMGRGLIQLTGKRNYMLFAASTGKTLEQVPDYLQTFEGAVQSACFFWERNGLNALADNRDITTISKRINGGTNGLEDRISKYEKCLEIFGVEALPPSP